MVRVSKRQKKSPSNQETDIPTDVRMRDLESPEIAKDNNEKVLKSFESSCNIVLKYVKFLKKNCHEFDYYAENLIIHQKLQVALNKIQLMSEDISSLMDEVNMLKSELNTIKGQLNQKGTSLPKNTSPSLATAASNLLISTNTAVKGDKNDTSPMSGSGIFQKFEPINRVVPRPSSKDIATTIGGKAHSLQFTVSLYIDLLEKVLGPAEETNLDYKAMVREAILITKAVISNLKEQHHIDPDLRWSYVDPTIKLEAYKKLEDATEQILPLKACSEFWGAHVLISNFWLKRKKTTKKKQSFKNEDDESPSRENSPPDRSQKMNPLPKKQKAFSIPFLTHP